MRVVLKARLWLDAGHLMEFGEVVPQGAPNAERLIAIIEDPASGLPEEA